MIIPDASPLHWSERKYTYKGQYCWAISKGKKNWALSHGEFLRGYLKAFLFIYRENRLRDSRLRGLGRS